MVVPASTGPAQDQSNAPVVSERICNASPRKLAYVVRTTTIITAGLLIFAGVMGLLNSGDKKLDPTYYLFAVYTTLFSIILLFFGLRLSFFDKFVANNFGFIFNFTGRSIFLAFLGSMALSLNPISISFPVAIVTLATLIVNALILCTSPSTSQYLISAYQPVVHKIPPINSRDVVVDMVANNPNAAKKAATMTGRGDVAVAIDVVAAHPEAAKQATAAAINNNGL